ncbi:MAG: low molecular weight phosphotyrosine protein phosphatase [Sphingopyxis sp.]|nr:low molecular weight phosphotyrosine protein phosphatase [Sphingopyxis sp.]
MQSVLFLCLGNICRSPLAEGAARAAFAGADLRIELDSAGTGDWHLGRAPDRRAQAIAKAHGVDISGLAARQLSREDYARFDLILAADRENLADLKAMAPDNGRAKLALMLDMVPGREGEAVADPYYGDADGFARCWADVSAVAAALVAAQR